MKNKLAGKYYFEWLGRSDRRLGKFPRAPEERLKWPLWARHAYTYAYFQPVAIPINFGDL